MTTQSPDAQQTGPGCRMAERAQPTAPSVLGLREQMLQILLRITEAVMQKPPEGQAKDSFAQSLAGLLFRVSLWGWGPGRVRKQLPTAVREGWGPCCEPAVPVTCCIS